MSSVNAPDPYAAKPWLTLYSEGQPADLALEFVTMLDVVSARSQSHPDLPLLKYFDGVVSYRELDEITDALAVALVDRGFTEGDRLAVMLQNMPQFFVGMVAAWKAGGIMVSVNPMNREREVTYILEDSGAKAILCLQSLYRDVVSKVSNDSSLEIIITTSELDFQTRNDERIFAGIERIDCPATLDLLDLVTENSKRKPDATDLRPDDIAIITYTSGTTGQPKGATNTHLNLVHNSMAYQKWIDLDETDSIYAVAPLFHITGLVGHVGLALLTPMQCVLTYRFEPHVAAEAIEENGCTFTIGAITVFIAMMNSTDISRDQMKSITKYYSGGAPIPPSILNQFKERFGHYIHNAYGLTETTSPTHFVPLGREAPVDADSGAASVGVPIYGTIVRIIADSGAIAAPGELGELQSEGPGVVPAYWRKESETEKSIPGGRLNTGDIGFMDDEGWYYIVDRKKDMINAAGYKVWPREVEDVLYTHPAVREAAVVGVPDEYRGETVRAYVSPKAGYTIDPEEIVAFCKERMAAYKYPRQIEIRDELPKTVTGKILRRQLRDEATS